MSSERMAPGGLDRGLLRIFMVVATLGPILTLAAALLPGAGVPLAPFVLAPVGACACALVVLVLRGRIRIWVIDALAAAGILLVTFAVHFGGPSLGRAFSLFYIWIALVAFCYLPLRRAMLQLALLVVCAAIAVFATPDVQAPASYWILISGTSAVAGLWMRQLMIRVRTLADADAARAQALAASAAKTEFLTHMSHELRTPLSAVMGFADLMRVDALTERQREMLDRIDLGASHLSQLIDDGLEIARVEEGRLPIHLEDVQLQCVLDDALALLRPLALRRPVELPERSDAAGLTVVADPRRLSQILINLLSNAIKYNRGHGRVEVRVSRDAGRVLVAVSDEGEGIPPDDLERVFHAYERLDAERRDIPGVGLGLAVCRALAGAMAATISVTSTVGAGSTFTLSLPEAAAPSTNGRSAIAMTG